jgi:integrase
LRQPIALTATQAERLGRLGKGLSGYIIESCSSLIPTLIPFILDNESVTALAKYLYRHKSRSRLTLNSYCYHMRRFSKWAGKSPDQLIAECKGSTGNPSPTASGTISKMMDEYVGFLQDEELSPNYITSALAPVKTFYALNGIKAGLLHPLPQRVVCRDRAPRPEELAKVLELASLRDKCIVAMLALGGFREGTLCRLLYRHVRDDLERGMVPVHVHVEAEITKGKYGDYDTFLGQEAVDYLKLYFEERRRGSPCGKVPPETITDESPLIRNDRSRVPRPICEKYVYQAIHNLYTRAGLLRPKVGRRYDLRAHSIRKYFCTQLAALGVPGDYIEYMMGHRISTYHDIEMKGIEFLRNVYAASGLSIRPKTQVGKIEALKEIIRAWGMNPDEILTRKALTMPARVYAQTNGMESDQITELRNALRDMMRKELLDATNHKEAVKIQLQSP